MLITLPNAYGDAANNMAIDAALLTTLPKGIAVLRHYGWTEPAITFGYTQRFAEVQAGYSEDLTLCRRLTGGGIVDHRNDWTYALILQTELPAAHIPANDFYASLHQAIQNALAEHSVKSQLAPCPKKCGETAARAEPASQCFVTPAANDVLLPNGQKIAGAAMKRSRDGLLVQGSIDRATLPADFSFEIFQTALSNQLSAAFDISAGHSEDLRGLFDSELIQTERTRFASDAWTQKR